MTIRAAKFTPEVLLSAPRRTPGLPNSTGEKAIYSVSQRKLHASAWLVGRVDQP